MTLKVKWVILSSKLFLEFISRVILQATLANLAKVGRGYTLSDIPCRRINYGGRKVMEDCSNVGVDGFIVVELPLEP